MKRLAIAIVAVSLVAIVPRHVSAFEATTTHAGITEQSALSADLHDRLKNQFGLPDGLFAALIIPPADAPTLMKLLRRFSPIHGYVPDTRGRMSALAWLVAGTVLADSPPAHAANHFYDPATGKGLSDRTLSSARAKLRHALLRRYARESFVRHGMPAADWVLHPSNPMNLAGFLAQYEKAVRARTTGERHRHLAASLLAAGSILHVLQDMGSPSHVRDDLSSHLQQIGGDSTDIGSRFERIAALGYGRLGIPKAKQTISRASLREFFTSKTGTGLADVTSRRWFTLGTLPKSFKIRRGKANQLETMIRLSLRRPAPLPTTRLDLFTAARSSGAILRDATGTCLARYKLRKQRLSWSLDDQCMLEQVAAILPQVTAYSAGLLAWLFRGEIDVQAGSKNVATRAVGMDFGKGTVELFWDDARGVRTSYEKVVVGATGTGQIIARAARPPKQAKRITILFKGVDTNGQPLIATGSLELGKK